MLLEEFLTHLQSLSVHIHLTLKFSLLQNDEVPGLLYFLGAFVMITSGLLCFAFPETKGKSLIDTFEHGEIVTEVNEDETFNNDNEILA